MENFNIPLNPKNYENIKKIETEGAAHNGELNELLDLDLEIEDLKNKIFSLDRNIIKLYEELENLHKKEKLEENSEVENKIKTIDKLIIEKVDEITKIEEEVKQKIKEKEVLIKSN